MGVDDMYLNVSQILPFGLYQLTRLGEFILLQS